MSKELPKILTVSINAWKDNSEINTLTEILSGWDKKKVAQVYMREAFPSTSVCERFFQISEVRMIRSLIKRGIQTGKEVQNLQTQDVIEDKKKEKELYKYKGKFPSALLTWMRELIWKFGRWKTKELNNFVDSYNPDILFIPIYPVIYMGKIQKYIMDYTKKPVVSYIADDNYSYLASKKDLLSVLHRYFLRRYVKYIIENSNQVFVITPKQKEEYDRIFNINSLILTKGVDYSKIFYKEKPAHFPIKMVYTGKLIIGRWKSLELIVNALQVINLKETKLELDIYTTDTISEEQRKSLNKNGCQIRGALTQQQVREVQQEADVLVFVESLEKKYRHTARLSFSTKITDYLSSSRCIFAIGLDGIAPIDYFKRYDSAIIATSEKEVAEKLQMLVDDPEIIVGYGRKGFECGKEHHEKGKMQKVFRDAICNLT